MSLQPGRKSSKSLHSNRWKDVWDLSSLKTYDNIPFEYYVLLCNLQRQLHIGYWKQLVLQNGKGLACETKPTVCKHKAKADAPLFKQARIDGAKDSN